MDIDNRAYFHSEGLVQPPHRCSPITEQVVSSSGSLSTVNPYKNRDTKRPSIGECRELYNEPLELAGGAGASARRVSFNTAGGPTFPDDEADSEEDKKAREHYAKTSRSNSKRRSSIVNILRKLSAPFLEDKEMDPVVLEERRNSRAQKLEKEVDNYCRMTKYE